MSAGDRSDPARGPRSDEPRDGRWTGSDDVSHGTGNGQGRGDPWWASGAERPVDDDRSPPSPNRPGAGHGPGSGAGPGSHSGRGFRSGSDTGRTGQRHGEDGGHRQGSGPGGASRPHRHATDAACQICPVCSLLRTLDEVRPEVVEHMSEAARHLTLAAKTFIDEQAAGYDTGSAPFERIDLDDQ